MKRLIRWAFSGLCLLSLLACLGAGWLWWRSGHGSDWFTFRASGERSGLKSQGGRIALMRLPAAPPADHFGIRAWVRRTRNADLRWRVSGDFRRGPTGDVWLELDPGGTAAPPDGALGFYRPLLDALEDPERFAAAHCHLASFAPLNPVLPRLPRPSVSRVARGDAAGGRVTVDYFGLRVELPPGGVGWESGGDPFRPSPGAIEYNIPSLYVGPAAGYDPAQLPALRDFWFRWSALPAGSMSFRLPLAAFALPPLVWLALRSRRAIVLRRRRRLGRCLRCGYDLAGNVERQVPGVRPSG